VSETPWTPGPWQGSTNWFCPGDCKGGFIKDSSFHRVADVAASIPGGQEQCEANMKLIAASPDLYEALKNLADEVHWLISIGRIDSDCTPNLAEVEAALKKAGG
jgi:hypothetical protein